MKTIEYNVNFSDLLAGFYGAVGSELSVERSGLSTLTGKNINNKIRRPRKLKTTRLAKKVDIRKELSKAVRSSAGKVKDSISKYDIVLYIRDDINPVTGGNPAEYVNEIEEYGVRFFDEAVEEFNFTKEYAKAMKVVGVPKNNYESFKLASLVGESLVDKAKRKLESLSGDQGMVTLTLFHAIDFEIE